MINDLKEISILGIRAKFSWDSNQQINLILNWAKEKSSRFICCSNAHMFVIAKKSQIFREKVFTSADLITLDGKPIHWLVKVKSRFYWMIGYSKKSDKNIEQVCGRDLMYKVLQAASEESISVGFYGSSIENLNKLVANVKAMYPNLNMSFCYSPPYRCLTDQERKKIITSINKTNTSSDLIGKDVIAYRARYFSITENSLWALQILAELGFQYDSSILPIKKGRYGISGFLPVTQTINTESGSIIEIPISIRKKLGVLIPISGGGIFRLYPFQFTRANFIFRETQNHPVIFYIHPWELDCERPFAKQSLTEYFKNRINISSTKTKLRKLLKEFSFGTLRDVIDNEALFPHR